MLVIREDLDRSRNDVRADGKVVVQVVAVAQVVPAAEVPPLAPVDDNDRYSAKVEKNSIASVLSDLCAQHTIQPT